MRRQQLFMVLVCLLLAGCGGLAGEPNIVSTARLPTITATAPPDLGYPPQPISLARGAEIFSGDQGCQQCHGQGGQGNGPVAANFTCKITDFTDPTAHRSISLTSWFALVTNGNGGSTSCLMPPWNARLNEQQRWDVTGYIYSLHYTSDLLAQGQKLWQDNCAACHGDRGAGDGPKANNSGRPVPNFTNPAYLITRSDADLFKTVTDGLGSAMPSFANTLDDNSRWAVVAYLRSLTWQSQPTSTPGPTLTPTVQPTDTPTVTVTGKLTNGTAGASLPANQPLTLRVIDNSSGTPKDVSTLDAKTGADGSFSFADLPRQNGLVYIITTNYAGIQQFSNPLRLTTGVNTLDLSFKVYEVTHDPSAIHIDTDQIIIDYVNNAAQINQAMRIVNSGDHIFLSDKHTSSGASISAEIALPADAQQITLSQDSTSQYVVSGTTIQAISQIEPDQPLLLQFTYALPAADRLVLSAPTNYPIDAMTVYVPQFSGSKVEGLDQNTTFTPGDPLQLQEGSYNSFNLQKPFRAGDQAGFVVRDQEEQNVDQRNTVGLLLLAAGIVFIGMILAIWRLGRRERPSEGK